MCCRGPTVLPCDSQDWSDVRRRLIIAKQCTSFSQLIDALQSVQSACRQPGYSDAVGTKPEMYSIFSDLKHCSDAGRLLGDPTVPPLSILLHVIDRAIGIEEFRSCEELHFYQHSSEQHFVISHKLTAAVIACSLLGLYAPSNCFAVNCDEFLGSLHRETRCILLQLLLKYFGVLLETGEPSGSIWFARQIAHATEEYAMAVNPLSDINIHVCDHPQLGTDNLLQIADSYGLTCNVSTMEMPDVMAYPELLVAMILTGCLAPDDYFVAKSSSMLYCSSVYSGTVDAIVVCLSTSMQSYMCQQPVVLKNILKLADILKHVFHTKTALSLPSASNELGEQAVQSKSRLRQKSWRSSASMSLGRGASQDWDTAADDTRRTSFVSATASSASYRHGTVLHGQMSLTSESSSSSSSSSADRRRSSCLSDVLVRSSCAAERRRSSCLSDVSVKSTSTASSTGSSKRSSTDYSSDAMDDYFDSIAHRCLQPAVIEEEVCCETPSRLPGVGAEAASIEPVTGPRTAGWQSHLLEHFVDNLINEAAQESKLELSQYLGELKTSDSTGRQYCSAVDQYAETLSEQVVRCAVSDAAVLLSDLARCQSTAGPLRRCRRGRLDRQQTVFGFRDSVLSEFADKLVSSTVSRGSPPGGDGHTDITVRHNVYSWFTAHTPASAIESFACDMVVDAFVDVIRPVNSASNCHNHRRQSAPVLISHHQQQYVSPQLEESGDSSGALQLLSDYACQLACCIVDQACRESICAQLPAEDSRPAETSVQHQLSLHRRLGQDGVRVVVSDEGSQQFLVILWLAASIAQVPQCHVTVTSPRLLTEVDHFVRQVHVGGQTTSTLMSKILLWVSRVVDDQESASDLFNFLQQSS